LARPSCASDENHRTDRDVGFRLRRAYGATVWAESGFALPAKVATETEASAKIFRLPPAAQLHGDLVVFDSD
jgi:hypothetical protein